MSKKQIKLINFRSNNNPTVNKTNMIPVVSYDLPRQHFIKPSREEWNEIYEQHLNQMYKIIKGIVEKNIPDKNIKWDNNKLKNNFSRLIYHCSSKTIDKNL